MQANETGRLEVTAAVLDNTVFQEGVRFLQQSPMEIQSMSSTSDRHCGGHGVLPAVHLHPLQRKLACSRGRRGRLRPSPSVAS